MLKKIAKMVIGLVEAAINLSIQNKRTQNCKFKKVL